MTVYLPSNLYESRDIKNYCVESNPHTIARAGKVVEPPSVDDEPTHPKTNFSSGSSDKHKREVHEAWELS